MEAFEIIRNTMNEFDKVPDDKVRIFISLVESLISRKKFGKMYEQALAYMAAHKMKLSGLGSTTIGGTIGDTIGLSSISEGETSVSFSNNQSANITSDAEFGLTMYGIQFLQIRKRCVLTIVTAGGVNHGSQSN